MPNGVRPVLQRVGVVVALGCVLGSVAILVARAVPGAWGEAEHAGRFAYAAAFFVRTFEPHGAAALGIGAIVLVVLRRWWLAALGAIAPLFVLAPIAWSTVRPSPESLHRPLKVVTANLLVGHASVDRVVRMIQAESPDVIFFQECTPAKSQRLIDRIGAEYPYRVEGLRDHAFGAAIFSRLPFVGEPELFPHESIRGDFSARTTGEVGIWDPQPRAVVRHDEREVVLQNVHFAPPICVSYLREQRVMAGWLSKWLGSERRAVVIAGDFNCTDSSINLGGLRAAGMVSVREAGRGLLGTWPSSGLAGWVPVGIDHILIRGLRCDGAHVGNDIDSDHMPLVARIGME